LPLCTANVRGLWELQRYGAPAIDGRNLAFWGAAPAGGDEAYFLYDAASDTIRPAAYPGAVTTGGFPLQRFSGVPSYFDGQFTAWAEDSNRGQHILIGDGETLDDVAYTNSFFNVQGGDPVAFQSLGRSPSIHGDVVAFQGTQPNGDQGIYGSQSGAIAPLQLFADRDTRVPLTGNRIVTFEDPSFDGTRVAFRGLDDEGHGGAFFASRPDSIGLAASTDPFFENAPAALDRQVRYFDLPGAPQMEGQYVILQGTKNRIPPDPNLRARGVFAHDRLSPPDAEDLQKSLGPRGFDYQSIEAMASDGHVAAYLARGDRSQGNDKDAIFAIDNFTRGPSAFDFQSVVIETGDELDGWSVRSFAMQPDAVSGNRIAFSVVYDNNVSAVYVAEPKSAGPLPTPATHAKTVVRYGNPAFPNTNAPGGQLGVDEVTHAEFSDSFVLRGPVPLDFDEAFAHSSGYVLGRDGQGTPTVHALSRAQGSFGGAAIPAQPDPGVRALANGDAVSWWQPRLSQVPSGEPIDVDITITLHGLLDVSLLRAGDGGVDPWAAYGQADLRISLFQESRGGHDPSFSQSEKIRLGSDGQLSGSLLGLGPDVLTLAPSQYADGRAYEVNVELTYENVTLINPGEEDHFAVELNLGTVAFVLNPRGEVGALADFLNSGNFTLSSDTPGVTFVQVPEPASILLVAVGGLAILARRVTRRRALDAAAF
jgi:hypothetical protein